MDIFLKKMKSFRNKRYLRTHRCLFLIFTLLILLAFSKNLQNSTQLGLDIFFTVTWSIFFILLIAVPVSSYWNIQKEIEKNSFHFLLLANFSSLKIILLQYLPNVVTFFIYALSTLPVLIHCFLLGGISTEQILHVYLAFFSMIIHYSSIGIFVAISQDKKMARFVIFIYGFYYIYFTIIYKLTSLSLISNTLKGIEINSLIVTLLFEILMSSGILFCSSKMLPKQIISAKKHIPNLNNNIWFKVNKTNSSKKIIIIKNDKIYKKRIFSFKKKEIKNDIDIQKPIEWKDYYFIHKTILNYKWKKKDYFFVIFLTIVNFFSYPLHIIYMSILIFLSGIKAFSDEKNFYILLISPISNEEIIKQKVSAIIKVMTPHFYIFFFVMLILCLLTNSFILLVIAFFLILHTLLYFSLFSSFLIKNKTIATICSFIFSASWISYMFVSFSYNDKSIIYIILGQVFIGQLIKQYLIKNIRKEKFIKQFM